MILLSFDIEEFDMPLEYKGSIDLETQLDISASGLRKILTLLRKYNVKATFFSTVIFAKNNKTLINELLSDGHELASHTWHHSKFEEKHLLESRVELEKEFNTTIKGLRMPRMTQVDTSQVEKAGYEYNSSINPTYLPGRYNNLSVSRTYYFEKSLLQLPASVSPWFRIPLFWLSFHHFPLSFYQHLANRCLKNTGYLNIYFHPWEFSDLSNPEFCLPAYTRKNTAEKMEKKFESFLQWAVAKNYRFSRIDSFVENL